MRGSERLPPFRRAVRFEDIDAAGIVFFARFYAYCHDAIEPMFVGYGESGYPGLIARGIGFPVVSCSADFRAPLRYGDAAIIEASIEAMGRSSCTFGFVVRRERDDVVSATVRHVTVMTDVKAMKSTPIPDDLRAQLAPYVRATTT